MRSQWNQWNQKNQKTSTYWTADARAGAETERADKQGQGGSLGARVKGLGLVQNRKFLVWESEAIMRRWTCRPKSLSLTSLTSCTGSGWSGTYQGNSKDSPLSIFFKGRVWNGFKIINPANVISLLITPQYKMSKTYKNSRFSEICTEVSPDKYGHWTGLKLVFDCTYIQSVQSHRTLKLELDGWEKDTSFQMKQR